MFHEQTTNAGFKAIPTTFRWDCLSRIGFVFLAIIGSVQPFNSRLKRPWEKPSSSNTPYLSSRPRWKKNQVLFYTDHEHQQKDRQDRVIGDWNAGTNDNSQTDEPSSTTPMMHTANRTLHHQPQGLYPYNMTSSEEQQQQHVEPGTVLTTEVAAVTVTPKPSETPRIGDYIPELVAMARPENLPGVVLFHMIGTYLAFRQYQLSALTSAAAAAFNANYNYWQLLASPPMMITLLALLLTSSTSMLVNDYFDYRLGNDSSKPGKPLQKVPLAVCKKALSYLYAISLFCVTMVPGVLGRVAVTGGLILTFLYTKHVKPRTWLKNALCATLISLSPLTSGIAAMAVLSSSSFASNLLLWNPNWPLVRLVSLLFVGIFGREIAMDINDCADDAAHSVQTVPVVYGEKIASRIACFCSLIVSFLAISGPLVMGTFESPDLLRRLVLASVGSLTQMRRYWRVVETEGQDPAAVDVAVDEGLLSIVLILASFV